MARNALVAGAASGVVRVLFYARGVRPVLRIGAMARQAKSVTPLTHNSRILRTVRIVATETGNAPRVHETLNEIVALHAVLVSGPVGEMRESCFAELVFLQSPKVRQVQSNMKADRPVVVFSIDGIFQWSALRMALYAGVVGMHIVEPGWI
jgi:hypothetical protein